MGPLLHGPCPTRTFFASRRKTCRENFRRTYDEIFYFYRQETRHGAQALSSDGKGLFKDLVGFINCSSMRRRAVDSASIVPSTRSARKWRWNAVTTVASGTST